MSSAYLNVLIVLTNFCWGIWGILDKKALDQAPARIVLLMSYLLALPEIVLLVLYVMTVDRSIVFNWEVCGWGALGSFTAAVAMIAYTVAMSKTEASFVLGITASYPLVVQLLASTFLHEPLSGLRIAGAALIGSGVAAVGYSRGGKETHTKKEWNLILFCVVIATLGWGIHGLFDKKAVISGAPMAVMIARAAVDLAIFFVMFAFLKFRGVSTELSNKKAWLFCILSAIATWGGYFASLVAMTQLSASYVIVITGCYPILMYLFAILFLQEKLNPLRLAGVIVVVLGGSLVQLTQG